MAGMKGVSEVDKRAGVRKVVNLQSSDVKKGDARVKGFYAASKFAYRMTDEGYQAACGLGTVAIRHVSANGPRPGYLRNPLPIVGKFTMQLYNRKRPLVWEDDDRNDGVSSTSTTSMVFCSFELSAIAGTT